MVRFLNVSLVSFSLAAITFAGVPEDPPIQLPTVPTIPNPTPPTPIVRTIRLTGETVYVISAKTDCSIRVHPSGLVKISREQGPIRIRSKFVDGNGSVESRKYDGPFVWILEPNQGKGTVELDVIPYGFKSDKEIASDTFDVDSGVGPQPPPKPIDPVTPPVAVKSFRVIWIHESSKTLPIGQTGILYSAKIAEYLNAKTTKDGTTEGWRRFDKDQVVTTDFPSFNEMWKEVKPKITVVPCWTIEVNGKVDILPFPKSEQEGLATLKQYFGDK